MSLNIDSVWRQDIDYVLIALSLPARVLHNSIIVVSDDNCKRKARSGGNFRKALIRRHSRLRRSAEQVPVVGHGDGRHLLLDGDLHQLIDIAGPVEQRIIGVAMQMDERRHDGTFRGGGTTLFWHNEPKSRARIG